MNLNKHLHRLNTPIAFAVFSVLFLLFIMVLVAQQRANRNASATTADVTVTVDLATPDVISSMSTGATHVQHSLDSWGDPAAVATGKQLLKESTVYQAQHIMGWGANNPQPSPGVYNWEDLDRRVQLMRDTGAVKVITLCCAPDWMKGGAAGQTDWTKLEVAPLPDYYDDFAELSKQVAMRYPDVEYFQVWNEFKGFYDAGLNRWEYEKYTQMYNMVYDAIKSVRPTAKIGGPYVVIDHWASTSAGGWPAREPELYNQPWGTADRRALDAISYWLANKRGADFITIDGGSGTREGTWLTDEYSAGQFFVAITEWIRKQPNGGATLPIWWAEWYASIQTKDNDLAHYNSVMANNMIYTLRSGATVPMIWGVQGDIQGLGNPETIVTDTRVVGGGQATLFYATQKAFKDYFGPGTQLYKFTSSSPSIVGIASQTKVLLVNTTNAAKTVDLNGSFTSLSPYQVMITDVPRASDVPMPTATLIPTVAMTAAPTSLPTAAPTHVPTATPRPMATNVIKNPSFESGLLPWSVTLRSPATGNVTAVTSTKVTGKYSAMATIKRASSVPWNFQFNQGGFTLQAGKTYTLSFWAKASKSRTLDVVVQQQGGNWTGYFDKTLIATTTWRKYTYTFVAPVSTTGFLTFNLAKTTGYVWFDDVSLSSN